VRKDDLPLDSWAKDVAPSTELRRWYGHDPDRFPEFRRRYLAELREPEAASALRDLSGRAATGPVTLVYSTHDLEHSGAEVLKGAIERRIRRRPARRVH
jgi:uncharacterized protein YeaO (DUF488 family)